MTKINLTKIFIVAAVSCMVFSCQKNSGFKAPATVQPTGELAKQLELSKQNLAAHNIDATIVSYQQQTDLNDDAQVAGLQEKLIADDAYVPDFNGTDAASFKVNTIRERMSAYAGKPGERQDVAGNIKQLILPTIKKGQKVLAIVWKANGKQFNSTCVYDDNGVVYDNMLSNIVFTEIAPNTSNETRLSAPAANRSATIGQAARQYDFTATACDVTIKWLWGSTRGKVVIKHYILWNGSNYIYDHGGREDAWMSAGSAKARWANNYLNKRSRSKMSWGYGWATPTASFSIKFNAKQLTFEASTSGVGSKGSGDGIHTIYLP